ncbi:MAG: hypothetical protein A2Y79_07895 [Deltaproteobacteria bacterium RBG_13_43_22]|nr:MAG: hypothetical protein A2Y79_07895 [Deltaproteobacteria bacterium RBG_13_43_22]
MNDTHRTKAELIKELEALRQQVARWEETESKSRHAEEAPKEDQKRYRALFENSPLGLWEFNPDETTIYMNQAMCAMLEIESPEDLNGKTYHSFFTPQSLETIAKEHAKRYQGVASSYEVEIIGNKGRKRKVLIHGTLVSSSKGELKSLIGIFIDVAERNLAVENLRKWAYIFEYADWGVGIVGAEGKTLVLMNPAFAKMHGYTMEELIGRPITEVFAPEYRDEVPEQIWIADEKNHHIFESKHIRKDGTVFPVQMDMTIVKDKEGRVQFRAVHVQDITERKRADEILQESEECFRRVFEEGPLGMCIANPDFHFTKINEAFCQMMGYTGQELASLTFKDITHPEHLAQDIESVNKLIAGEIPAYRTEKRYLRKDGKTIWAASTITVMKDHFGQVLYFLSLIEDITIRKQVEEELRESERRYHQLIDSSIDAILLTAPDGSILTANPAACHILGYTEDEIRKLGRAGVVDTSDPKLSPALEERSKTGKFMGELTLIRKDGTRFPGEVSTAIFRDKDGHLRTSMIIRDITERKRAEEALRESEEKYRTILKNIEDGYYEVDLAGNFTFFNDALTGIHEYSRNEMMGMNSRQYTDAENVNKIYRDFSQVYRTGKPHKGTQYEIITKTGGRKSLETSVSLIREPSGKVTGFRGIVRDITELKQAQKDLQESEDRYRDLVESSRDLISIHDLKGQILWVNEEPIRILGYEKEYLLKMNVRDLLTSEGKDEFDNYLATIKSQGIASGLMTLQTAKGEKRIWEYKNTLRTEGVDEPIVRSMARDVTERMHAEKEVKETVEKLRKAMGGIIQAMALTVETRDPYTAGHQRRVADLARSIAQEMGLPEDQVDGLRMAAHVHDLGKIGIPAEILSKPTELNSIEFKLIKVHPQISYDILKDIDFPWPVAQIIFQHHERMNGSGYPLGLSGEDICLEARILAVADVVEATSSHRPYRPAHGIDEALEEISQNKGILYDPEVVDVCLRFFREKGFRFN